jgi:hypothetical protein
MNEADLGGYLFKKRIARADGGKSGGYRTILGFRKSDSSRVFYLYGFPKNARANITPRERAALEPVRIRWNHLIRKNRLDLLGLERAGRLNRYPLQAATL